MKDLPKASPASARGFVLQRIGRWRELDDLLSSVSRGPSRKLTLDQLQQLGRLYREVSVDLVRAERLRVDATTRQHLNELVSRSYATIYRGRRRPQHIVRGFFGREFPRLVRKEWALVLLSGLIFLAGGVAGAAAGAFDGSSQVLLISPDHQAMTPSERVEGEAVRSLSSSGAASFSALLFTHNLRVSFLVFALGLSFGIGSLALLFYNGVPLGALAVHYHQDGQGLFFWSWILPHGVLELPVVILAGASGLMLARGLWVPGRRSRGAAVRQEARRAVRLLLGSAPWMILAGVVEGTLSQMHPPRMPYAVKLAVASVLLLTFLAYLMLAGRGGSERSEGPPASPAKRER